MPNRRGIQVNFDGKTYPHKPEHLGEILHFAVETGGRIKDRTWTDVVPCEVERDARWAARGVLNCQDLSGEEKAALVDLIAVAALGRAAGRGIYAGGEAAPAASGSLLWQAEQAAAAVFASLHGVVVLS